MAIHTEEGTTQLISVLGLPMCDLVYYMARTINVTGFRCLVLDNSGLRDLFHAIPKASTEESMTQTGEIYYVKNVSYSKEFFSCFDFVLIYHGYRINKKLLLESDYAYIQTDYREQTTGIIAEKLKQMEVDLEYILVLRDKIFTKISNKMLMEELGLSRHQVKETFEVEYNEQDYMCYLGLLRNGSTQFKHTSSDMKELIKTFLQTVLQKEKDKEVKDIYRQLIAGRLH